MFCQRCVQSAARSSPLILFAGTGHGSKDLKSFVRAASASDNPPALVHSGSGTVRHLVGELFSARTKIKFNMVPYKGSAPALVDVAAGLVVGHFATLASGASLLSAGKITAVAVTGQRWMDTPRMRNVPTLTELGIKDLEVTQWWALVAPSTTPIVQLERLRLEALAALAHESVQSRMLTLGVDLKGRTRYELRSFMRSESERWQSVARGIGLQPQ